MENVVNDNASSRSEISNASKKSDDALPPLDDSNAIAQLSADLTHVEKAQSLPKPLDSNANIVDWDGPDDPRRPLNWSLAKRIFVTGTVSLACFIVTFGSSIISPAIEVLAQQYHVSPIVSTLSLSLYVLGFAAGPMFWAPLGDVIGHKRPQCVGFLGFMCFTVGVATARNLYTIMICRFMQGAWGVVTVVITPGMIMSQWSARVRPLIILSWGATIVIGPTVSPVIGGFVTKNSSLGWRWTQWITLIISSPVFLALLLCEETWDPLLLQRKAARQRFQSQNWALHAKLDEQPTELKHLLRTYGLKPAQMLFREPILAAITMYNTLVYAVIYLSFEAYPYSFGQLRGWSLGVSSLPFLSLTVGALLAGSTFSFIYYPRMVAARVRKGQAPSPEDLLPPMIAGSVFFCAGLFWFGWTSFPGISWVPQVLSVSFVGIGFFMIFLACQMYLVECYLANANSAIAANTVVRSAVAAGFPLFATPMYHNLGMPWATSLLGFLGVALAPFPVIFYVYGKKIRSWSKFAY